MMPNRPSISTVPKTAGQGAPDSNTAWAWLASYSPARRSTPGFESFTTRPSPYAKTSAVAPSPSLSPSSANAPAPVALNGQAANALYPADVFDFADVAVAVAQADAVDAVPE